MNRPLRCFGAALLLCAAATPAAACHFEPQQIYYAPGATALPPGSGRMLDVFIDYAKMYGDEGRIWLRSHTDRVGDGMANIRLTQRRAAIVRDYLVRHGIPASRIDIMAVGEAVARFPTADDTPEPRNRFVELEVVTLKEAAEWRSNRDCG